MQPVRAISLPHLLVVTSGIAVFAVLLPQMVPATGRDAGGAPVAADGNLASITGDSKKREPTDDPKLGTLEGVVVLKGQAPEIAPPEVPTNHQDHTFCAHRVKSETLILGKKNELKNVVVAFSQKLRPPTRPRPMTVRVDNKDCLFAPHVQAATVGSSVVLTNSDPLVHNVHGLLLPPLSTVNQAIPAGGEVRVQRKFRRGGWGVVICDFHAWMQAQVYVFPHELFDVTDAQGTYRIAGIPPGTHEIEISHEKLAPALKPLRKKVTIEPGKVTKLDIELSERG